MHIRSLAAGFTFRTAEYTVFPGNRSAQNSTAPDFAALISIQWKYEIIGFWSLIILLIHIAINVFII